MNIQDVVNDLRVAYDRGADRRDGYEKEEWKLAERSAFLERLKGERCGSLLEVGAGTGQDSRYFADHGIDVVATDLSPENVDRCRAKGLDAQVMNLAEISMPADSFEAVYSLNCLLHVPNTDLPSVLSNIRRVLRQGGLFYLGVWGGHDHEGPIDGDNHEPPRFFSFRTDEQILEFVGKEFVVEDFHVVRKARFPFQSLTLRRPV